MAAPGVIAIPVVPNSHQVELLPRLQRTAAGTATQRRLEHADPAVDVGLAPRVHERPGQPHDAVLPVLFRRRLLHVPLASGDDVAVAPGDVVTAGEEGAHGVEEPADLGLLRRNWSGYTENCGTILYSTSEEQDMNLLTWERHGI